MLRKANGGKYFEPDNLVTAVSVILFEFYLCWSVHRINSTHIRIYATFTFKIYLVFIVFLERTSKKKKNKLFLFYQSLYSLRMYLTVIYGTYLYQINKMYLYNDDLLDVRISKEKTQLKK